MVQKQYALKSIAFDLSGWHGAPSCDRMAVAGIGGIGVKIVCLSCGVLCDVEALGTRITVQESYLLLAPLAPTNGAVPVIEVLS